MSGQRDPGGWYVFWPIPLDATRFTTFTERPQRRRLVRGADRLWAHMRSRGLIRMRLTPYGEATLEQSWPGGEA